MQFGFGVYGAWWFSLIYIIFAYGLWLIFPKFVQIRFSRIPFVKYISNGYKYTYILLLLSTIFILFQLNNYFYIGIILYISGLIIFISAIFFFSINEIDLIVSSGIYKYSRHPVYLGFFVMWLGVSVLTLNLITFILTVTLGILSYKIAEKEEEICIQKYGNEYKMYQKKVKLFFGRKI